MLEIYAEKQRLETRASSQNSVVVTKTEKRNKLKALPT